MPAWIIKVESKNELKEIDIKTRACYYFDDIINGTDIDFTNFLSDKKSYNNVLVHDISCKTSTYPKPLRVGFDQIDGFIIVLDGKIKNLMIFNLGLLNKKKLF